jgi:acyl dehydratase
MSTALRLLSSLRRRLPAGGIALPELAHTRTFRAEPARLAAFRALTRYPDDGRLPLTYPQVAAFPSQFALLADPRCPLPVAGMIHVAMDVEQTRPIGAGERTTLTTRMTNGRRTARGYEFDFVTDVVAGGETVWTGVAGMLFKQAADAPKAPKTVGPPSVAPAAAPEGALSQTWKVGPALIRAYARVSRDVNPIHLSTLTAKAFGMPRAVAHGMWTLTRLTGLCLDRLGDPHLSLSCRFKLPLFVPGTAIARRWDADGVTELRLFDHDGTKPHVVASLRNKGQSTVPYFS